MSPLTTTYEGFYNFPRTQSQSITAGLSSEEKFTSDMKAMFPGMPEQDIRSLYCGNMCNFSQGNALAILLMETIYLVDNGKKIKLLWYTHFGSAAGDGTFKWFAGKPDYACCPAVDEGVRQLRLQFRRNHRSGSTGLVAAYEHLDTISDHAGRHCRSCKR